MPFKKFETIKKESVCFDKEMPYLINAAIMLFKSTTFKKSKIYN